MLRLISSLIRAPSIEYPRGKSLKSHLRQKVRTIAPPSSPTLSYYLIKLLAVFPICFSRDVCDTCYASIGRQQRKFEGKSHKKYFHSNEWKWFRFNRSSIYRTSCQGHLRNSRKEWQNFFSIPGNSEVLSKIPSYIKRPQKIASLDSVYSESSTLISSKRICLLRQLN